MSDDYPESLVLLHVAGGAPATTDAATAALDRTAVTQPARDFLGGPDARFLGAGAMPTAPERDPQPRVFVFNLMFDGQPSQLTTDVDSVTDQLIALYLSGGWDWVNALLDAMGPGLSPMAVTTRGPRPTPQQTQADRDEFIVEVSRGVALLKQLIEDAVVELALSVFERARERAPHVRAELDKAERRYGVRQKSVGGSGSEDEPGGEDPLDLDVHEPEEVGAAADLMGHLRVLRERYLALQQILRLAEWAPTAASGGGTPPLPEELDAVRREYRAAVEAAAQAHPISPGVFALCIGALLERPDQPLDEQRMLSSIHQYFVLAEPRLLQIPAQYPQQVLRYEMKERLSRQAARLGAKISDTPELRAMWWASRPEKQALFEPLLATQMIDAIRAELVGVTPPDEDELIRTAFMLAVIHSLSLTRRDVDALRQAQLDSAQRPYQRFGKTAAALSLLGLLAGPVAAVGGGLIGAYSLYGHCMNQFAAMSALTSDAETIALDALLADDAANFALTLGTQPGISDLLTQAATSVVVDLGVSLVAPVVGTALQILADGQTLME